MEETQGFDWFHVLTCNCMYVCLCEWVLSYITVPCVYVYISTEPPYKPWTYAFSVHCRTRGIHVIQCSFNNWCPNNQACEMSRRRKWDSSLKYVWRCLLVKQGACTSDFFTTHRISVRTCFFHVIFLTNHIENFKFTHTLFYWYVSMIQVWNLSDEVYS